MDIDKLIAEGREKNKKFAEMAETQANNLSNTEDAFDLTLHSMDCFKFQD